MAFPTSRATCDNALSGLVSSCSALNQSVSGVPNGHPRPCPKRVSAECYLLLHGIWIIHKPPEVYYRMGQYRPCFPPDFFEPLPLLHGGGKSGVSVGHFEPLPQF